MKTVTSPSLPGPWESLSRCDDDAWLIHVGYLDYGTSCQAPHIASCSSFDPEQSVKRRLDCLAVSKSRGFAIGDLAAVRGRWRSALADGRCRSRWRCRTAVAARSISRYDIRIPQVLGLSPKRLRARAGDRLADVYLPSVETV